MQRKTSTYKSKVLVLSPNTLKQTYLQGRVSENKYFSSKWENRFLYPDTFKANGSYTEVEGFQLRV